MAKKILTGNKKYQIAIDVSPLNDGNAVRGVGYYTKNLVNSIQVELKTNPDYQDFKVDLITSAAELKSTKFNLIHYPYFDPFKLTLPTVKNVPFLVTVHDLIPREFKSHFPVGIKGEFNWLIQQHRLKQAKYLVTVSHYSKFSIHQITGYPLDRIFVTYEAANNNFKTIKDEKKLKEIKTKYQLPDKFVLFVGDINWNKNIPSLVKACFELKYPLVIAGSAAIKQVPDHPWTQDVLWLQQQKNPLLHLTGFVPDDDLPYLYNLATIYCQPSYAEGFGLTLIEAMQSGCPTVYSQETSLGEIGDFNGRHFDPYSPETLIKALTDLWTSRQLRLQYSQDGQKHAKIFSWQQTALQTLAVYRLALLDEK